MACRYRCDSYSYFVLYVGKTWRDIYARVDAGIIKMRKMGISAHENKIKLWLHLLVTSVIMHVFDGAEH